MVFYMIQPNQRSMRVAEYAFGILHDAAGVNLVLKVAGTLRVPFALHALDIRKPTACAYYFAGVFIGVENPTNAIRAFGVDSLPQETIW